MGLLFNLIDLTSTVILKSICILKNKNKRCHYHHLINRSNNFLGVHLFPFFIVISMIFANAQWHFFFVVVADDVFFCLSYWKRVCVCISDSPDDASRSHAYKNNVQQVRYGRHLFDVPSIETKIFHSHHRLRLTKYVCSID